MPSQLKTRPSPSVSPSVAVPPVAKATASAPSASSQPNRCSTCRKRVGLTGFKCRCGKLFCGSHRYADEHSCAFDYKTAGRQAIAEANPIVKADKVVRF